MLSPDDLGFGRAGPAHDIPNPTSRIPLGARRQIAALVAGLALAAGPATAQVVVHDPLNYASLIRQAETALSQLDQLKAQVSQAQRLYDGFNSISKVNSLATLLASPALRAFVPDIDAFGAAATGDISGLGRLGDQAAAIRKANRLFTPPAGDAPGQDLEAAGDRAARDLALGQQTATVGAQRLTGLQQLTAALDTAPDARAMMDLQARLAAEHAMIANDQMRLQGLAMAQDAETRLQAQRDRERAAADAAARLELFQRGFK
jgi:type IV secretion system protein VirB5